MVIFSSWLCPGRAPPKPLVAVAAIGRAEVLLLARLLELLTTQSERCGFVNSPFSKFPSAAHDGF
jgi:hypothetical protein